MSDFIYPIVNDAIALAKVATGNETYDPAGHSVVGLIVATLYWRDLIRNILPDGSNGIHIVFSICSVDFTYEINGPEVKYVGPGDFHDAEYDDLGIHSNKEFMVRDKLYSGAPLDPEYCHSKLSLYPSDSMKASYTTMNPVIFTVAVLFIFAFTSLVFYLYDVTVERRQRSVMNTAVRSSYIVSSLFPAAVRARLFTEDENTNRNSQRFANNSALGGAEMSSSSPIAELYPDTTVMFADIAGFTSWSSTRQPTQVFHLLEVLYSAFDEIAKQRGVFKVETIGDCYLAVVGLPTPRKAHAVVMAKFAEDCRNKTQELTARLDEVLGPVRVQVLFISNFAPPWLTLHLGAGYFGLDAPHWTQLRSNNGRCSTGRTLEIPTFRRCKCNHLASCGIGRNECSLYTFFFRR
jgi:Adenylate and Guanylate cyclase catalytic domain